MSDYLHHLVASALSPEAGVRPQLRSAFEPAPLRGGFAVSADSESETLVESISSTRETSPAPLPLIVSAPFEHIPSQDSPDSAPDKSSGNDEPPLPPTERAPSMKVKVLQPVINAPPDSIRENSRAVSTPPATSRSDSIPMASYLRAAQTSDPVHPAAAVVQHQTVESEEPRYERLASVASRSVVPAAAVFSPSPAVAPSSGTPRPVPGAIRTQTLDSEERRSERFAVAAIRPVAHAAPAFSPSLPSAVAPPPPTIHVTIGCVEIRAVTTSAPPARTTLPAVSSKLSLEDYLKQRNGTRP
jgi:hypothetical protein